MTNAESLFTIGQRAYWIHETPFLHFGTLRYVFSGVVMSTGPAVTQVWDDSGKNPREHHAVTFANDRIWPDRGTPARIIRKWREAEERTQREAEADDAA